MKLILNLSNIDNDQRLPFCKYIAKLLEEGIDKEYNPARAAKLEEFINDNNIIKWFYNRKYYMSVYELYKLAIAYLDIKKQSKDKYIIEVNKNINIPNSYTKLYSIISLLESGNLSVNKYGLLGKNMQFIVDNFDTIYIKYALEKK